MSPTHFKVKSLSGKIFTSVLAFTLAVIVALSVTMTTIYYLSYAVSYTHLCQCFQHGLSVRLAWVLRRSSAGTKKTASRNFTDF